MKRLISVFAVFLLLICIFPNSVSATTVTESSNSILYLPDGYYIAIELTVQQARGLELVTGTKSYTCRDINGVEQWRAVLTGTFSYNGSSATCSVSTCDVTITNTNWYVISKTATKSGNVARCSLTMGLKHLGITVDELAVSMKLTCDARGNLS